MLSLIYHLKGIEMHPVVVFIKNEQDPSSYYRIYQYMDKKDNVCFFKYVNKYMYRWYYDKNCDGFCKGIKKAVFAIVGIVRSSFFILYDELFLKSKSVVINRAIFPRIIPGLCAIMLDKYLNKRTVYWDFDDNIILEGEITKRECEILERQSEQIIVTHQYLVDTISKKYRDKVITLSTTDEEIKRFNCEELIQSRSAHYNRKIILIWIGTKNNLEYLEEILPQIDEAGRLIAKKTRKSIILKVISNKPLNCTNATNFKVQNIPWTREEAISELKIAHIGLMPLKDDEYTRGKGGFKAVQYIGAGIPAIVSNVGFNSQVVEDSVNGRLVQNSEGWIQSIYDLSTNYEMWIQNSRNARKKWEKDFNSDRNLEFWLELINK